MQRYLSVILVIIFNCLYGYVLTPLMIVLYLTILVNFCVAPLFVRHCLGTDLLFVVVVVFEHSMTCGILVP